MYNVSIVIKGVLQMGIKDSGARRAFETGAVRDMQNGKGRCDLMPLGVLGIWNQSPTIKDLGSFQSSGRLKDLERAYMDFCAERGWSRWTADLELSKHFEDGAEKYGENNWQKGLPVSCYIDSAVRHYLKWRRGDTDERHDRAFLWNIVCCGWEVLRQCGQ